MKGKKAVRFAKGIVLLLIMQDIILLTLAGIMGWSSFAATFFRYKMTFYQVALPAAALIYGSVEMAIANRMKRAHLQKT